MKCDNLDYKTNFTTMNLPAENELRIEYFEFEKEFMDDNIRCIPMIVRFKLDACGIKLKLKEWNKMNLEERENLAILSIDSVEALASYRSYVEQMIMHHMGGQPTYLSMDQQNASAATADHVPIQVCEKLRELNKEFSLESWQSLSVLKRYALLKLTRPGHENKNFPKALREFGLI